MMIRKENGFTLVELLVALALTGMVMAVVYKTFASQQKVYVMQEDGSAMQQDLRAAMEIMSKDLRMAGYCPSRPGDAGIVTATASTLTFTLDSQEDGDLTDDPGDRITYSLSGTTLGRTIGAGVPQPVGDNIDALNFVYLDADGNVTVALTDIRSIQLTLVARSEKADKTYNNKSTYRNQQGAVIYGPTNDAIRRRLLTSTVRCRNLGAM